MTAPSHIPLAERSRPTSFDEIVGQEKLCAPGALLRTLVEQDRFYSFIFWGPPGSGKTSVAQVIARASTRKLAMLSAVSSGVQDLRAALAASQQEWEAGKPSHLLFVDEIHRLSKNQQDVLLPALEAGSVKFIGATTDNPSFEVNRAIISRSLVFPFEPITPAQQLPMMQRAVALWHEAQAALSYEPVSEEILEILANSTSGDARRALNLLEALLTYAQGRPITRELVEQLSATQPLAYDKKGENHYDVASALIKSIRASDADAALYYLARMLDAGEDPRFIARRLIISAAEDIGNANPHGLNFAVAAAQAVQMVGMPEARIILAQICCFLAASPKSNRSYVGIEKALAAVEKFGALDVPLHLRNAPTNLMKQLGYGKGYRYPHDDPDGAKALEYLPEKLRGLVFYQPSNHGHEAKMKEGLRSKPSHQ